MDYGKSIGSCLLMVLLAAWEMASAQQPRRVLYATLGYKNLGLFIADGDGTHERALLRLDSSDYNGSFSADGKWIIFTSERNGSACQERESHVLLPHQRAVRLQTGPAGSSGRSRRSCLVTGRLHDRICSGRRS